MTEPTSAVAAGSSSLDELGRLGVSAVAPGVWRAAIPFPGRIGYSFSYLIETSDGFVAVDLGWDSDEGMDLFRNALALAGGSIGDLRGVVVTHAHADHFGLAGRLRDCSDAWIAMHPAEVPTLVQSEDDVIREITASLEWYRVSGVPEDRIAMLRDHAEERIRHVLPRCSPDLTLVDGATVPLGDARLVALHTPGHTPGHLCFVDREHNLLFAGDHVLPRIRVNVPMASPTDVDPLADYLASLEAVREVAPRLVLPGHEWAFDRLPARLAELEHHHAERLDEVGRAVAAGLETVWEVAGALRWSRPFETFESPALRTAMAGAHAHLTYLARQGVLDERPGTPTRWRVAPSGRR
jgi:glyoxylase-like metal-dependent hydrolase (beta-lactamase superfamily II)